MVMNDRRCARCGLCAPNAFHSRVKLHSLAWLNIFRILTSHHFAICHLAFALLCSLELQRLEDWQHKCFIFVVDSADNCGEARTAASAVAFPLICLFEARHLKATLCEKYHTTDSTEPEQI
jgi:hypothetical protein